MWLRDGISNPRHKIIKKWWHHACFRFLNSRWRQKWNDSGKRSAAAYFHRWSPQNRARGRIYRFPLNIQILCARKWNWKSEWWSICVILPGCQFISRSFELTGDVFQTHTKQRPTYRKMEETVINNFAGLIGIPVLESSQGWLPSHLPCTVVHSHTRTRGSQRNGRFFAKRASPKV